MAILEKPQSTGSHWYFADGSTFHTTLTKAGTPRPTDLRDVKKKAREGFPPYPSVTNILNVKAKFGLQKWQQEQVALSALRNPKQADETEEYWMKRVIDAAFAQVSDAADLGSDIHAALEAATAGEPWNEDLAAYVQPVLDWYAERKIRIDHREKTLVNTRRGFAGTADVLAYYGKSGMVILDYKTKKTKPGQKIYAYGEHRMQLAAYAATHYGEDKLGDVLAANIFISSTEPGRVEIVKHEDLPRHYAAFLDCCALWRYEKGYDPRAEQ